LNAQDLFNIHDLLIVGYWAPMMKGPHLRNRVLQEPYVSVFAASGLPEWPEQEDDQAYGGLKEARKGAVMLATIITELHPVGACRDKLAHNLKEFRDNEELLVEKQAATAWECVNVTENDVVLCGPDGMHCGESHQTPLTTVRNKTTGKLVMWEEKDHYRNFELRNGDKLGACRQPLGSGGPKHRDEAQEDGHNKKDPFKKRCTGRKTAWLRACSFWSAFHVLALRADALGGEWPNKLFGSIVRIIAGGALFCGG
jgi:hypothetical protein